MLFGNQIAKPWVVLLTFQLALPSTEARAQ